MMAEWRMYDRPMPSHTEAIDYARNNLIDPGCYTRWEIINIEDNTVERTVEIVFALWHKTEGRVGEFTFEIWIDDLGEVYGEW